MAEEFSDFIMSVMKKKTLKEKVDILTGVTSKVISTFITFIENIENRLDNMDKELISVKNQIVLYKGLEGLKKPEGVETKSEPKPHVNKPLERPMGNEETKDTVIGELKELFKKRGKVE
jgi:hypothetical protein